MHMKGVKLEMFPWIGEQPQIKMLFNNFPSLPYVSGLMGKCWNYISVYRSFSIMQTKSLKIENYWTNLSPTHDKN